MLGRFDLGEAIRDATLAVLRVETQQFHLAISTGNAISLVFSVEPCSNGGRDTCL